MNRFVEHDRGILDDAGCIISRKLYPKSTVDEESTIIILPSFLASQTQFHVVVLVLFRWNLNFVSKLEANVYHWEIIVVVLKVNAYYVLLGSSFA